MKYKNILETIGNTPLVEVSNITKLHELNASIFVKVESRNPGGSVKDRVSYQMIKDAMDEGKINKDTLIVEATSGNTGIGLAMVTAALNMKLVIVMPSTMSIERQKLIKGYGAELILTDGALGMKGSMAKALEIVNTNPNSIMASQFDNPSNPKAHLLNTGREIYEDLNDVDIFVSGIGTGGTVTGIGRYLKSKKDVKIYGVEPFESSVINGEAPGKHKIQGIGAGFIPSVLDLDILEEVLRCPSDDAIKISQELMKYEGIMAGISSGASLWGAIELAKRPENKGKNIVCLLPDTAERYLSTALFD